MAHEDAPAPGAAGPGRGTPPRRRACMDSLPRHPPEDNRGAPGAACTGRRDAPAPSVLGPGLGRPQPEGNWPACTV
jgi:hypothetical protein